MLIKNRQIECKLSDEFTDKGCFLYAIEMPDIKTSETYTVETGGFEQSFSDTNPTPYVDCKVIYKVRDSDEGRKLFKAAQDLVNDPILKGDYPRETLTIMQTATDGNTPTRPPVNMSDCVVKQAEINIDVKEGISIGLVIHGLYNKPSN